MPNLLTLMGCALVMISGCTQGPAAPSSQTPDLSAAPTDVVVAGKRLTLTASLWRDYMPPNTREGGPLTAILRVETNDGTTVPGEVRADAAWVVYKGETWSAAPREERPRSETQPVYELVARDGPKWGPDVAVDVVIRLRAPDGRRVLLRARDQLIRATQ